jgi:hypothetical protein
MRREERGAEGSLYMQLENLAKRKLAAQTMREPLRLPPLNLAKN